MTTYDNARYILERYRPGGANRYACPRCGRKKCFTRYVDTDTGQYIADDCGKCDHAASCGYHYPPRLYFRDHPGLRPGATSRPEYINGKPLAGLGRRNPTPPTPQQEFFPLSWAERAMPRHSAFRTWFESLPFDRELTRQVLADYYVGATAGDVVCGGANRGPAAVFWMIDERMRPHDAKLMAYRPDGHRVGGWANSMRAVCMSAHVGPQLEQTDKVLFGLHLLPRHPGKTVCVVESEKTALVCACRYPGRLWVATGGCGNLTPDRLRPLRGRRVMVYPDSGELAKWTDSIARSGLARCGIAGFMEAYEPNTDIADVILGEARPAQAETWRLAPPSSMAAGGKEDKNNNKR